MAYLRGRLNALINSPTTMNLHSFHSILPPDTFYEINLFHQFYGPIYGLLIWNLFNDCLFMHSHSQTKTQIPFQNAAHAYLIKRTPILHIKPSLGLFYVCQNFKFFVNCVNFQFFSSGICIETTATRGATKPNRNGVHLTSVNG